MVTSKAADVTFFNPQVENWTEACVAIEADNKMCAHTLLFVVGAETRAVASMIEASEYIAGGRNVVLVLQDIADGAEIGGAAVTGGELKDLNRGRRYLADVASRHGTPSFATVEEAVDHIIGAKSDA